jgi:hypothetical protein
MGSVTAKYSSENPLNIVRNPRKPAMQIETNKKQQQTEIQTQPQEKPTFQTRFGDPFSIGILLRPVSGGAPSVHLHSVPCKQENKGKRGIPI